MHFSGEIQPKKTCFVEVSCPQVYFPYTITRLYGHLQCCQGPKYKQSCGGYNAQEKEVTCYDSGYMHFILLATLPCM